MTDLLDGVDPPKSVDTEPIPRAHTDRAEAAYLLNWMRSRPMWKARRAMAIMLRSHAIGPNQVELITGLQEQEIEFWEDRYRRIGIAGLDAPRPSLPSRARGLGLNSPDQEGSLTKPESISQDSLPSVLEIEGTSLSNNVGPTSPEQTSDNQDSKPIDLVAMNTPAQDEMSGIANSKPVVQPEIEDQQPSHAADAEQSIWTTQEPLDGSDPTPSEQLEAIEGKLGWKLIGASRRGLLHGYDGKYREDAFQGIVIGDWHVIVVADGAGSAPLARVGANTAVASAIETLNANLSTVDDTAPSIHDALLEAVEHAYQQLTANANDRKIDLRQLATTLLLLVHKPTPDGSVVGVVQVGDGAIFAYHSNGQVTELGQPEHGQFAGETQFLTHITNREDFSARILVPTALPSQIQLLLVMTDGVADDFYPPARELPRLIQHLSQAIGHGGEAGAKGLLDLIGYRKRGSFDDRTLVVLAAPDFVANLAE